MAILWIVPKSYGDGVNCTVSINYRQSSGFSLIEILVAVLILGVGLLATARMQIAGIQNTQGGYMRAQASNLAYDMVDRMRTNTPAVTDGDYDLAIDGATPTVVACKGQAVSCSTTEMADFDQFWWRSTIDAFLPSGAGSIETEDNGTFTTVTVTLTWFDPTSAADGAEQNILTAELPR